MQFFFSHHRKIFVHFWAQKKTSLLSFTIDFFFFNLKRHLRTQCRRVSFHFWQRKQKSDNNFDKVKFLTKKCLGLKTLENNAQCHVPFLENKENKRKQSKANKNFTFAHSECLWTLCHYDDRLKLEAIPQFASSLYTAGWAMHIVAN